MPDARPAARAFFPLDSLLELGDGLLSPALDQGLARLGAVMAFGRAAQIVEFFTGTRVSASSLRRRTLSAGASLVEADADEVDRLEREAPDAAAPDGERLQVSVDGAMVPVVGPDWVEVKTVAVGVVRQRTAKDGSTRVVTDRLSYFSRVADSEQFTRSALVEMHRRGVERAQEVCAVNDGAVWIDSFVDTHRPDAVRILDFAHAAGAVSEAAKAAYGDASPKARSWFEAQRRELLGGDPARVLAAIARARRPARERGEAADEQVRRSRAYLIERRERIEYARMVARGYPIGSGAVESANKLVVEARLKGAGMHWARANVNAMLTLTNAIANERWAEAWSRVAERQKQREHRRIGERASRRNARRPPCAPAPPAVDPAAPDRAPISPPPKPTRPPRSGPRRPSPDHPWQIPFSRKRRLETVRRASSPKP